MSMERKSISVSVATLLGRKLPRLTSTTLRFLGPVLPNLWIFYWIARECNLRVPTPAKLGNGMKVKVFLGDMIGCHIWHRGWYEPHLVKALTPYLTKETIFFDLGANIGQYTLLSSPLVQEVHSFEPFAETYELLKWNVQHNHLANVHINQLAVSDRTGDGMIYDGGPSNVGATSLGQPKNGEGRRHLIRTTTLDQYVFDSGLQSRPVKIVLKMDIEGGELLALQGAPDFLSLKPIIFLEAIDELQKNFGNSTAKLTSFLLDRGYALYSLSEQGRVPYSSDFPNILALPTD
jgi:FkbM family methyltransferase